MLGTAIAGLLGGAGYAWVLWRVGHGEMPLWALVIACMGLGGIALAGLLGYLGTMIMAIWAFIAFLVFVALVMSDT